jgi:uncharacterized protein (DUF1800 family)
MKNYIRKIVICKCFIFIGVLVQGQTSKINFPYLKAGLTQQQAAAHLLNRCTFGIKPNDINNAIKMGLENWVLQQLQGNLQDTIVAQKLKDYDALQLSNAQIIKLYPRAAQLLKMAKNDGYINSDSLQNFDKQDKKDIYKEYREKNGLRPEKELFRQLINQKIIRAAYSNNQLQEVITDFWFNHFNVSLTKNECAQLVLCYERDAIRPNVFGKFSTLLLATAQSPAMLVYLDNFSSVAANDNLGKFKNKPSNFEDNISTDSLIKPIAKNGKKMQGLNENYAREVMELHTMGVDGGYTQTDVTEAARMLTGWTVYPLTEDGRFNKTKKIIDKIGDENLTKMGFVVKGDFLFLANKHDNNKKTILGNEFAANGGYNEGVALLNLLAHHKATANFISKKIATRFVSDTAPASLIAKMVATFIAKDGDIKEVLLTMFQSVEFWNKKGAYREKTKSPFEYAISSIRAVNANILKPYPLAEWIQKMGQKFYFYQAPTGFADRATYWINSGALLNRMNFGIALAAHKIKGIEFDLAALNNNHEPESANEALATYAKILLPQRDIATTIKRLTPFINDPIINKKIETAAASNDSMTDQNVENVAAFSIEALAQIVGIIIGSPEFQRR